MEEELEIYNRSDIVNFLNTGTPEEPVFTRMQGFTSGGKELNAKKYARQYIDEDFERESTTGYSPSIPYNLDRIKGNSVHEKIVAVHEDEIKGAIVEILTVDMFTNEARLRNYNVNPENQGDGTDAYTYSGSFKSCGKMKKGIATVSVDGLTATFVSDEAAAQAAAQQEQQEG